METLKRIDVTQMRENLPKMCWNEYSDRPCNIEVEYNGLSNWKEMNRSLFVGLVILYRVGFSFYTTFRPTRINTTNKWKF